MVVVAYDACMEDVFRALAHPSRRELLDRLYARRRQTCDSSRRGREKLHDLNPVPLGDIVRRWVGKFEDARLEALADFKNQVEKPPERREPEGREEGGHSWLNDSQAGVLAGRSGTGSAPRRCSSTAATARTVRHRRGARS